MAERADILELIAPLSPFVMLDFCRAVFTDDPDAPAGWDAAAARLVAAHPELAQTVSGDRLRTIHERLLAAYPELAELTSGPSTVEPARAMFLRLFYELISRSNAAREIGFMNLGYDYGDDDHGGWGPPKLGEADEAHRYSIQLYHQLFTGLGSGPVAGKEVVEVGCGRGGGSDYVARYLGPKTVTGVDITRASIDHCARSYTAPNLRFVVGNAVDLPLADACADVVMNLESSHCYPSMPRFLAEVRRILRPGGVFVFSDIRHRDSLYRGYEPVATLDAQLAASGLELRSRRDITDAVRRAIEIDGEAQIERWDRALAQTEGLRDDAAAYVRKHFRYAVGLTTDSRETWHERFAKRNHLYLSYVLRAP